MKSQVMGGRIGLSFVLLAASGVPQARATLTIAAATTQNVTCTATVCTATSANAVLNSGTLAGLLATRSVTVTATAAKTGIEIDASVSWASAYGLTLKSGGPILFNASVTASGTGPLTLSTANGGTLAFTPVGKVTFGHVTNALTIDGNAYTLVNSVASLVSVASSGGYVALAKSFSAAGTTYTASPLYDFDGTLEGLGNTISGLTIKDSGGNSFDGLVGANIGTIADLRLANANLKISAPGTITGGILAGTNYGTILRSSSSGTVSGSNSNVLGGLVGYNTKGTIDGGFSSARVSGGDSGAFGGLVGLNDALIIQSGANGTVSGGGQYARVGGFVGMHENGAINNSFAWGAVSAGAYSWVGGFVGVVQQVSTTEGVMTDVYEAGPVATGVNVIAGAFSGHEAAVSKGFYFKVTNPTLPAVAGLTTPIRGLSAIALSNLGYSSLLWQNETICARQQAIPIAVAIQQGLIADNHCN